MTLEPELDATSMVALAIRQRAAAERPRFLRDIVASAAAALTILEGQRATAEALYGLADVVVAVPPPSHMREA